MQTPATGPVLDFDDRLDFGDGRASASRTVPAYYFA
jgi:hypothetical protein